MEGFFLYDHFPRLHIFSDHPTLLVCNSLAPPSPQEGHVRWSCWRQWMPKRSSLSSVRSGTWGPAMLCTSLFRRSDIGHWPTSPWHRETTHNETACSLLAQYEILTHFVVFLYFNTFLWCSRFLHSCILQYYRARLHFISCYVVYSVCALIFAGFTFCGLSIFEDADHCSVRINRCLNLHRWNFRRWLLICENREH